MSLSLCPDGNPDFLLIFDLSIAPPLLFYAYIPIFLLSIFFGNYILSKSKRDPSSKFFSYITLAFGGWIFLILFQWIAAYLEVVHLAWQLLVIPELLIFIFSVLFCYGYLFKKSPPRYLTIPLAFSFLLTILAVPTRLNITSFDLLNCEGVIGRLWDAIYVFELIYLVLIAFIAFEAFHKAKDSQERNRAILLPLGLVVFLGIFWASNYFGELTKTYEINLIGPLGMALLLGVLSYMIVRFKAFNVKVLGTQILVAGVWFVVFAILFIPRIDLVRLVVVATLILLFAMGYLLIGSVKREVEQREHIEKLAVDLQKANEGKTNLIHIMNHQIKGYLAKSRNIFADLLEEPDYKLAEEARPMVKEGLNSLTEGVGFVEQVLNGSSAESGALTYVMRRVDFGTVVRDVAGRQEQVAINKGLKYELSVDEGDYKITGDAVQLKQAVRNLIDNSIHYTPSGSISMHLSKDGGKVRFEVKDTGLGISPEDRPRLFTVGGRGRDALKYNVESTGYGLSFVKSVAEAHKGKVGAESAGPGKGSTFWLELPTA